MFIVFNLILKRFCSCSDHQPGCISYMIEQRSLPPKSCTGRDAYQLRKYESEVQSTDDTLLRMRQWPGACDHLVETNHAMVALQSACHRPVSMLLIKYRQKHDQPKLQPSTESATCERSPTCQSLQMPGPRMTSSTNIILSQSQQLVQVIRPHPLHMKQSLLT